MCVDGEWRAEGHGSANDWWRAVVMERRDRSRSWGAAPGGADAAAAGVGAAVTTAGTSQPDRSRSRRERRRDDDDYRVARYGPRDSDGETPPTPATTRRARDGTTAARGASAPTRSRPSWRVVRERERAGREPAARTTRGRHRVRRPPVAHPGPPPPLRRGRGFCRSGRWRFKAGAAPGRRRRGRLRPSGAETGASARLTGLRTTPGASARRGRATPRLVGEGRVLQAREDDDDEEDEEDDGGVGGGGRAAAPPLRVTCRAHLASFNVFAMPDVLPAIRARVADVIAGYH